MDRKFKNGQNLKVQWDAFVQTTDEQAYRELYSHYYKYLSFIALKKGYTAAKTKDCINDLFLYLWENTEKLQDVRNHHNYIVTGFLRKLFRTENFSAENSIALEDELPELLIAPSAEAQHIRNSMQLDVSRILQEYVKKLPAKQRQMIYQKFYLGLSYHEISEANAVSINTVYSTVYNALDRLRMLIGKEQLAALVLFLGAVSIFFLFFL